jgi:hypothetical protein
MASLIDLPPELLRLPAAAKLTDWLKAATWAPIGYRRHMIQLYQEYMSVKLTPAQIKIALTGAPVYD